MVDFDHGEHAIFDKGLKIELSQTPFHPKRSDLPKLSQRQQLAEELHKEDTEMIFICTKMSRCLLFIMVK